MFGGNLICRGGMAIAGLAVMAALAPAAAGAATNVSVSGDTLNIQGDSRANVLDVYVGSSGNLRIDESYGNSSITIGSGCWRPDTYNRHSACNATGVTKIIAHLGDSADNYTNKTALTDFVYGEGNVGDGTLEILNGGKGLDVIDGGAGADRITDSGFNATKAFGFNNLLFGGAGDDEVTGSGAVDLLQGGAGKDTLSGGFGNDYLDLLDGAKDAKSNCGGDSTDIVKADTVDVTVNCEVHQ